jgi:hypothetical protein
MSMRSPRCAPLLAMLVAAGCGSSGSPSDGGDAAVVIPDLCGDAAACPTDQLCVSEQSCTSMVCTPVADGGTCPAGTSSTPSCPDGGPPGCLAGCSVAYACEARPAGCATLSCACATALCSPGTCLAAMGTHVACAAP